jgi:hypothetical protein
MMKTRYCEEDIWDTDNIFKYIETEVIITIDPAHYH